jgi:hypothetical protein
MIRDQVFFVCFDRCCSGGVGGSAYLGFSRVFENLSFNHVLGLGFEVAGNFNEGVRREVWLGLEEAKQDCSFSSAGSRSD